FSLDPTSHTAIYSLSLHDALPILINSAVAAYYYLRIIVLMYMYEQGAATAEIGPVSPGLRLTMWASALGTLVLGIIPTVILNFADRKSTRLNSSHDQISYAAFCLK